MNYIDPIDVYDVLLSVKPIVMVLLGGAGTVLGAVYGAFLFLLLEELVWRNLLQFHAGLLGIIVVALVLFLPMGIRGIHWPALFRRLVASLPAELRDDCHACSSRTCRDASADWLPSTMYRSSSVPAKSSG